MEVIPRSPHPSSSRFTHIGSFFSSFFTIPKEFCSEEGITALVNSCLLGGSRVIALPIGPSIQEEGFFTSSLGFSISSSKSSSSKSPHGSSSEPPSNSKSARISFFFSSFLWLLSALVWIALWEWGCVTADSATFGLKMSLLPSSFSPAFSYHGNWLFS